MYIGQDHLKEVLAVRIQAAKLNGTPLDPVLLDGPPGCGKTTLAKIIAHELDVDYDVMSMTDFRADMFQRVVRHHDGVLLLDEIHSATKKQQDSLLTLLEEGYFQHRGIAVEAHPNLTIVGATTEPEALRKALIERFRIRPGFDPYTDEDMAEICIGMIHTVGLPWDVEFAEAAAPAAVGIPRRLTTLVGMKYDLWLAGRDHGIDEVLRLLRLTPDGLGVNEVKYLKYLDTQLVAGADLLARALRISKPELLEIERIFMERGYIAHGPNGRSITPTGTKRVKELA